MCKVMRQYLTDPWSWNWGSFLSFKGTLWHSTSCGVFLLFPWEKKYTEVYDVGSKAMTVMFDVFLTARHLTVSGVADQSPRYDDIALYSNMRYKLERINCNEIVIRDASLEVPLSFSLPPHHLTHILQGTLSSSSLISHNFLGIWHIVVYSVCCLDIH